MYGKIKPKGFVAGIRHEKGELRPCEQCGNPTNYYQHDFVSKYLNELLYISITKCKECSEKEERIEEWMNKQESTERTICPWCALLKTWILKSNGYRKVEIFGRGC